MSAFDFEPLLEAVKDLHRNHAALQEFAAFPDDITAQETRPFWIPAAQLLQDETRLTSTNYAHVRDAVIAAAPHVQWRETYKDTDIGADFMDRFGCYEIIGRDTPFASNKIRSFVVYQPAHLHYPWHHHPADELYVVLAGQAEFFLEGASPTTLHPGDSAFHPSNTPHALTTHDHPVMTYVIWRDQFETAPVWSASVGAKV
ncbi:dimethylsulfonioproprionate lyase family protein [Algirhabdus cladophorae]|uniref:dimethylsulfonioproprionate lyase family protein n=1 Tax=Algirhabdus cladophorae TaxID=3377108 RepID=UPI003B84B1C5